MSPSMCLAKYNHTLLFREGNISYYFSAVSNLFTSECGKVKLLYLLIEEFSLYSAIPRSFARESVKEL